MSIKDELIADQKKRPCRVREFLSHQSRETQIEYIEALAEPRVSAPSLVTHMYNNNEAPGVDTPSLWMIKNHRRGECSCDAR